jgi:hypothetical protein
MRHFVSVLFASLLIWPAIASAQDTEVIEPPTFTPGANEAVIYFVRPARVGGAINFFAFVDETPVGATRARDYTGGVVPAGERVIWARSGNVSAIRFKLEPGQTYYFEQEVKMGAMRARVGLEPMDADDFREATAELDFKALTAEGRARAAEILATDYQEAVEVASAFVDDDDDLDDDDDDDDDESDVDDN